MEQSFDGFDSLLTQTIVVGTREVVHDTVGQILKGRGTMNSHNPCKGSTHPGDANAQATKEELLLFG